MSTSEIISLVVFGAAFIGTGVWTYRFN